MNFFKSKKKTAKSTNSNNQLNKNPPGMLPDCSRAARQRQHFNQQPNHQPNLTQIYRSTSPQQTQPMPQVQILEPQRQIAQEWVQKQQFVSNTNSQSGHTNNLSQQPQHQNQNFQNLSSSKISSNNLAVPKPTPNIICINGVKYQQISESNESNSISNNTNSNYVTISDYAPTTNYTQTPI